MLAPLRKQHATAQGELRHMQLAQAARFLEAHDGGVTWVVALAPPSDCGKGGGSARS